MKIHFIGIGGIGMSGIAKMCLADGHAVSGTDLKDNDVLAALRKQGAQIFIGHDGRHVEGAERVVYSSSIKKDHVEVIWAKERNIPVIHRSMALAEVCQGKFTVAVAGTHGKTTTTSLVGMILKEAGRKPSVVVGGVVEAFGGNALVGAGKEIVIEADESDASFLNFTPNIEIITNIEAEHLDHFGNLENIKKAFREFIERMPSDGFWMGCAEDPIVRQMARQSPRSVQLYGFDKATAELWASDVKECPGGKRGVEFTVWRGEEKLGQVQMKIVGRHNVLNSLAACGVGLKLGIPFETIAQGLSLYPGARRRFDVRFEDGKTLVVDDYAHHPTEIQKTLAAAKALKNQRVVAIFQPHRYTRTESFLKEFGESFADADHLIITDIYAASEAPIPGITGERVAEVVREKGHKDVCYAARELLSETAKNLVREGDLLITLGAGDVYQVAYEAARFLRDRRIFGVLEGKTIYGEPLSRHTSLKIGGPARIWFEPKDNEDLKKGIWLCREHQIPYGVIGAGSNTLASDAGFDGMVIHLGSPYFKTVTEENGRLVARAGVPNTLFIQAALDKGYGGCEFLSGIPGNIGGAVAMNAGSHGQSVDLVLESAKVLDEGGVEKVLTHEQLHFSYRHAAIGKKIILEATFNLARQPREVSQKILDDYRDYRAKTQDLWHASAGCMFKNPSQDCSSGKLIDEAGLKGKNVGRAQVSDKHANFIINLGGAKAQDVLRLIEEIKGAVKTKFNVDLETEVKVL